MLPDRKPCLTPLRTLVSAVALASLTSATAAWAGGGGVGAPEAPRPADVTCIKGCLDVRTVAAGGKVLISGENLQGARTVLFPARQGRDVSARALGRGATTVKAKVPKGADTGRPVVADSYGQSTPVPVKLKVKPAAALSRVAKFKVTSAHVSPRKSYVGGRRPIATYVFKSKDAVDVRVDITNADTGELVNSIVQRNREPFARNEAAWDGLTSAGGVPANGKYRMSVTPLAGGGGAKLKLKHYDHIFPLRTGHKYGDGLGAGRGHMGQDVFGKCGEPIVAARGGRVTFNKFQSRAGNYVVIDGIQTKLDYFYAHLKKSLVHRGDHVKTGQLIGYNGDTGNASGCHLHFEVWKGPWQQGGKVVNPTPLLKRWDSWS